MLSDHELAQLRAALITADYTVDGVPRAISTGPDGDIAHRALARGERVAALRALDGDGGPLATLVRLFLLGSDEPADRVSTALGGLPVERALAAGLLEPAGERVRAGLDVRPYGDPREPWYVVSDVGTGPGRAAGPVRADHVLGVGGASLTLAHATPRRRVGTALDLGTGCGVQALHLSGHAASVTATDANPRALTLARATALLSGVEPWELLPGDLLAPVAGRRFDLVVSNPPFVVGPSARFTYRDSGLPGDDVGRLLVHRLPEHLADGGVAVLLANWLHRAGESWAERVEGWVAGAGCDAFVVQREVQDPAEYAELWLRDSGDAGTPGYERLYGEWLAWFAEHRVEAVGFGIVVLRRTAGRPAVRVDEVRHEIAPPLGPVFGGWLDRVAVLRDADLLATRFALAPDVRLDERSARTADGWSVVARSLVQESGLRLTGSVDEFGAALLAACDGNLPLGTLVELLATAYGLDTDAVAAGATTVVRGLVESGFLLPV